LIILSIQVSYNIYFIVINSNKTQVHFRYFKASSNSCSSVEQLQYQPTQQRLPQQQASFVDTSPYFNDLNASFKRLYKSILDNKDIYESEFNSKFQPPSSNFNPMTNSSKNQQQSGKLLA